MLSSVRHKGGVNLIQALALKVGSYRSDAKGETQVLAHKSESSGAGHSGGPTRSSVEVSVMEMDQRGWIVWLYVMTNQQ